MDRFKACARPNDFKSSEKFLHINPFAAWYQCFCGWRIILDQELTMQPSWLIEVGIRHDRTWHDIKLDQGWWSVNLIQARGVYLDQSWWNIKLWRIIRDHGWCVKHDISWCFKHGQGLMETINLIKLDFNVDQGLMKPQPWSSLKSQAWSKLIAYPATLDQTWYQCWSRVDKSSTLIKHMKFLAACNAKIVWPYPEWNYLGPVVRSPISLILG